MNLNTIAKPKLMVFAINVYGHHSSYMRCLLEYFFQHNLEIQLDVVISRHFLKVHRDFMKFIVERQHPNVNFIAITQKVFFAKKLEYSISQVDEVSRWA